MDGRAAIGVGLVGYGLAGRLFHAPYIRATDGLELRAIATTDPRRSAQAHAEHPAATVVASADRLFERPDIELVVVAAPNRSHAPLARRALAAGRHVVVDKPIAIDVASAGELIEAALRGGRQLSVFHNRRWDSDFLMARDLVARGELGALDSVEARFERWAPVDDAWRETEDQRGGPLPDLGTHLIDQSLLLLGPAERVSAQSARRRPGSRVPDSVFVAVEHAGGGWSRTWVSLIAARGGPRMRVRGTTGEFVRDHLDIQEEQLLAGLRPGEPGFAVEPVDRRGTVHRPDGTTEQPPPYQGDYRHFYAGMRDAIRDRVPVPVDPLDAVNVLRVVDAAELAASSGQVVRVAPT